MKIFLSYILLFLYTLTCTGSTLYMHVCDKGTIDLSQTTHQKSCSLCDKESKHADKKTTEKSGCGDQNDCCKDVKVDLKKGDQEIETAPGTLSFLTLSPAIVLLHWIILVPQTTDEQMQLPDLQASPQFATTSPPYLIHCNFRI